MSELPIKVFLGTFPLDQLLMKVNRKCCKAEDKELLEANPAHVNVQSCHHKVPSVLNAA